MTGETRFKTYRRAVRDLHAPFFCLFPWLASRVLCDKELNLNVDRTGGIGHGSARLSLMSARRVLIYGGKGKDGKTECLEYL